MYYWIKPKTEFHGRRLKKWYRIVRSALGLGGTLPANWTDRPPILVPELKLGIVLDRLKVGSVVWS